MEPDRTTLFVPLLHAVSRAAGTAVTCIGGLVLLGWVLDIGLLKSLLPGMVTMKFNSALAFALSGVSLRMLSPVRTEPKAAIVTYLCVGAVFAIGALTMVEYLADRDLGIDELFFRDTSAEVKTSSPGRMAPTLALSFVFLGASLALLRWSADRGFPVAQVLCILTLTSALLALLGYIYGVEALYGVGAYTRMALHSALGVLVVGAGILLRYPDRGLLAIVTSAYAGGVLARRLTPAALLIPPLLGRLLLAGDKAGLYETETELTLFALLTLLVFAGLTLFTSRSVNLLDSEGQATERSLRERLQARVATEQEARAEAQRLEQLEKESRQVLEKAVADCLAFTQQVAQGELSRRLALEHPGALGQLGKSLNEMVESLEESFRAEQLAQAEARRLQEEIIRVQAATLAELSTPLIPISDQIVAMPLIGTMDTERAQQVLEALINGIAASRARIAILDITGVPTVDTLVADGLLRAARGVQLLGAQVVLTGIRPEVAQTLVTLGVNLTGVVTQRTLQSGIEYAMGVSAHARRPATAW